MHIHGVELIIVLLFMVLVLVIIAFRLNIPYPMVLLVGGTAIAFTPGLPRVALEYFYKQAHWLTSRFPDGVYADVEGLCKVVSQKEIEAKDWSLSPGRYVGVDTATDDDFDYEERLNEIHIELDGLNEEAVALVNSISENYKELAI